MSRSKRSSASQGQSTAMRLAGRTMHLIDIENICGGSTDRTEVVRDAVQQYIRAADVSQNDQFLVASGPRTAFAAAQCLSGARVVLGRGVDGADHALLAAVNAQDLSARFENVVVASGDHIFTDLVRELRSYGVNVRVAARAGSIAASLYAAAADAIRLPDLVAA